MPVATATSAIIPPDPKGPTSQIDRRGSGNAIPGMSEVFDRQPILRGELLRLRPLRPEDWDDLYAVASDPLIWEQHPSRDRNKEEVFKGFFSEALASGGALIAIDAKDGRVIGSSRFHGYDREKSEIEIGWTFLARSCWGGIYNAEMKELMLRHAFKFVQNVVFVIGSQNLRSQRAVEKIGAVRVGSGPRADGTGQDSFLYRILAPRSPSAKD
jgi:RimJ/RimL family protein N-acetyltransferase